MDSRPGCPWGENRDGMMTKEERQFMVEACLSRQFVDYLNEWEEDFLRSVMPNLETLTPKQEAKLEEIFDRINR